MATKYVAELLSLWGGWDRIKDYPLDEPIIHSQIPGLVPKESTVYYSKFLQPQGIGDAVAIAFVRDTSLLGSIGLGQLASAGPIANETVKRLRLIAPHFRRAAVISKLPDLQTIAARTYEAILGAVTSGVIFLDAQQHIVYANKVAEIILARNSPVGLRGGLVVTQDPLATTHLQSLIAMALVDERQLGHRGIGVPVRDAGG